MKRMNILGVAAAAGLVLAVGGAVLAQQAPGMGMGMGPGAGMGPGGGMGMGMGPGAGMGKGMGPMFDFDTLDTDKDGTVTRAELDAARTARVDNADANGDGLLSLDELKALHLAQMSPRIEARAKQMIAHLDADGDGQLSVSELAAGPGPAMMFNRLDANGDGALSQDEADRAGPRGRGPGRGYGHHGGGWFWN